MYAAAQYRAFSALCCAVFLFSSGDAFAVSAGAYTLWNHGPVSEIAISGANVAHATNSAAVVENQAAIAMQHGPLQLDFDFGQPSDARLAMPGTSESKNHYLTFGASALFGRFGIGVGADQLRYLATDDLTQQTFSDSDLDFNLSAAFRVSEAIALSGAWVRTIAHRETTLNGVTDTTRPDEAGNAAKFGAIVSLSDWATFGITHKTATLMTASDRAADLFDSSYAPQVTQIGLSFSSVANLSKRVAGFFSNGLGLSLQADKVTFPKVPGDLYYAPAVAFAQQDAYRLDTNSKIIPRAGLRLVVLHLNALELTVLGGSYLEPAYLKDSSKRYHKTFGVSLSVLFAKVTFAVDSANGYLNRNYGFSLMNYTF